MTRVATLQHEKGGHLPPILAFTNTYEKNYLLHYHIRCDVPYGFRKYYNPVNSGAMTGSFKNCFIFASVQLINNMKILKALAALALAFTVYNTNAQCSGYSVLIDLVPDTTCVGDPVLINATTGSSMSTFSWQLPSGQILSGSSSLYSNSVVLADSGRYIVTANSGPCTAKDTAYLKIGTRPALTPSVTTNIPVCIGDTLKFDIIPAQTFPGIGYALYDGSNNKLSSTKLTKIPNASVAHMGYYKIAVTDSLGCATSVNYLLGSGDINPKPANPKISPSKNPACVGETVVLTATGIPSGQFRVWTDYNNNPTSLLIPSIIQVQQVHTGLQYMQIIWVASLI